VLVILRFRSVPQDAIGPQSFPRLAGIMCSCAAQVVMRRRQQRFNYGQRCTPVSLDAYSLDSVSVRGSVRRKSGNTHSKRSYGNPAFDDPVSKTHAATSHGVEFKHLASRVRHWTHSSTGPG
jgi:hypothetical protein